MRASSTSKLPPLSWESPPARLAGLGPTSADALDAFGIRSVADLVWTLPAAYDDLRAPLPVDDAVERAKTSGPTRVAIRGVVDSVSIVPMRGRRALRVVVRGDSCKLHAWWFFFAFSIHKAAVKDAPFTLVGKVMLDEKKPPRMIHPDFIADGSPAVRVRYPKLGVAGAALRKAIVSALEQLPDVPDPVPHEIAVREGFPAADALVRSVHLPTRDVPSPATVTRMRERLAWAEVFTRTFDRLRLEASSQGQDLALALREAPPLAQLESAFGWTFTDGQRRAVAEIGEDLAVPRPTRRLLLGDVGTGKTAVALAAIVQAVRSGAQAALLAPTTVLAEQYEEAAAPIVKGFGVRMALLTSGTSAAERRRIAAGLAEGSIDAVFGTHALLSDDVRPAKLGLVVVDEQHRLGVAQRLALVQKGSRPHLLTLTATPIPRTLALAIRGDLPVTTLGERPRGREPVVTELCSEASANDVVARVRAAVARGEQVFVVCPRVEPPAETEDGEDDEGVSAVARAEELTQLLAPTPVVLVHGSMGHVKKSEAMRAFRRGDARVLVGTTVVEVGVDVPNATLMIVESAHLFGLAQLHQLRGRVGRGAVRGTCILMFPRGLEGLARERLEAMARLDRGEDVARADLELRGAGDLWGTKQSGDEEGLVYLAEAESPAWLTRIEADAARMLATDPELAHPEHHALGLAVRRFRTALAVREEAG